MDPDHPWGRAVLPDRADLRGLAVQLRRVGPQAPLAPVHQLLPADPEDQSALAGLAGRIRHAHRPPPADQRGLAGLVRPEVRPARPDLEGRLRQPGQVGLVAPAQVGCIPLPQVR
jgi:hypothetical protein